MKEIRKMHRKLRRNEITIQEWWEFIKTQDQNELREVVDNSMKAEQRLNDYRNSFRFRMKIRKYCNLQFYSDIQPFEVVRVVSDKCVELRRLDFRQTVFPTQFHPGGFSAICADGYSQDYEHISNPENPVFRIRLGKKGWGKGRYVMSDIPIRYYDYNF